MTSDVLIYGVNGANAVPLSVDATGALNTTGGGGGGGGASQPFEQTFVASGAGGNALTAFSPSVTGQRFVLTGYFFSVQSGSNANVLFSLIIREGTTSPNNNILIRIDFRQAITATVALERIQTGLNIIATQDDRGIGFSYTVPAGTVANIGIIGYYTPNPSGGL